MQNEQTLIELGFCKDKNGEYIYKAENVSFIGVVIDCNGPVDYIQLYKVHEEIDRRPLSDYNGRHYKSLIKDCCSVGSVERAIKKYGD